MGGLFWSYQSSPLAGALAIFFRHACRRERWPLRRSLILDGPPCGGFDLPVFFLSPSERATGWGLLDVAICRPFERPHDGSRQLAVFPRINGSLPVRRFHPQAQNASRRVTDRRKRNQKK